MREEEGKEDIMCTMPAYIYATYDYDGTRLGIKL